MAEGKLTLPVLYALNTTGDTQMAALARKVKARNVSAEEIAQLVEFTKNNGGIAYAERKMAECQALAIDFIDRYVADTQLKNALKAYVDFIIDRKN